MLFWIVVRYVSVHQERKKTVVFYNTFQCFLTKFMVLVTQIYFRYTLIWRLKINQSDLPILTVFFFKKKIISFFYKALTVFLDIFQRKYMCMYTVKQIEVLDLIIFCIDFLNKIIKKYKTKEKEKLKNNIIWKMSMWLVCIQLFSFFLYLFSFLENSFSRSSFLLEIYINKISILYHIISS